MSIISKYPPGFWRQLFWKVVVIGLLLLLLAQMAIIWLIAEQETSDAFASGRRLLISLNNDAIEGKLISSTNEDKIPSKEIDAKENEIEKKIDEKLPTASELGTPKSDVSEVNAIAPDKAEEQLQDKNINMITSSSTEEKVNSFPAIVPSKTPPAEFSINLSEKTESGFLPKIASDGTKPWKYYSKPITLKDKKPIISIIVTGLGQDKDISEQALRLPEEINLSFSPYAKDLNSWMVSARLSGHEILIDLPMEATDYPASDPGPLGLLVSKEQGENETKIRKLMTHDIGYVGFITPRNEAFIENNELFKSLLQVLSGRGLMLIISKQPPKNETKEMIERGNTASVIADLSIDEELTTTAIQARLSLLEQTAKQNGYAIGLTKGYPVTITQLNEWATKINEKGFNLVPVSVIISKRY